MFALGKDDGEGGVQSRRKRAEAHCVFVRRCAHLMSRSIQSIYPKEVHRRSYSQRQEVPRLVCH